MIRIDAERIFREIEEKKPSRVTLSAPDGLLRETFAIASQIGAKYGIEPIVMGDSCYGSCDTTDDDVKRLGADIAFNIGHTISLQKLGKYTVMIDAFDDVSFDKVLEEALPTLKKFGRIGIVTSSQHLPQVGRVKAFLEERGLTPVIGKGRGQLLDGQVFGCEFYPAFNIREQTDAFIFLGQSRFHALGVALSTGKPTFMLDPYMEEVVDMESSANERLKKAILRVYKAVDAERIGIIIGLKEGQIMVRRSLELKKKLESFGKKVDLIAMREVTDMRLAAFRNVDAFIQTACPRISVDGETFDRPVLSSPQAEALILLLEGKDLGMFLQRGHWL
ncbi:MAG: diphthamide biosynthesis enzyme Dph2 [Thaumarchaeota archaeon]|nr:diphthamide biosynthesis enzyme Dph2 [Nitrososphaerota archaeon]